MEKICSEKLKTSTKLLRVFESQWEKSAEKLVYISRAYLRKWARKKEKKGPIEKEIHKHVLKLSWSEKKEKEGEKNHYTKL